MDEYRERVIRKKITFYGDVQGVGFRYRAKYAAELSRVKGYCMNNPDGSVLMEIQGTEEQIDSVIIMISNGRYINISSMTVSSVPVEADDRDFVIRD